MSVTREIFPSGETTASSTSIRPEVPSRQHRDWQTSLAYAIRDLPTLLDRLQLPRDLLTSGLTAVEDFPVLVPESFLHRMRPGDPADPLLLQILPAAEEAHPREGFVPDPVQDAAARAAPGLLQKYAGRALLIAQGSCAVHCRYCFRRHYPYAAEPRTIDDWQPALDEIRRDSSLHEVILSGGDPLILSDRRLAQLIHLLAQIPHLKRLRLHTRLPIVLPERVTPHLLDLLQKTRLQALCVIHSNHARELVNDCAAAVRKLVLAGIPVLNQAVLLHGVNDSVEALTDLCERCVDLGVMPYYLHQLDRVQGAAHFEVPQEVGRHLVEELRARLPGYAVPRYVVEEPGAPSKTPL